MRQLKWKITLLYLLHLVFSGVYVFGQDPDESAAITYIDTNTFVGNYRDTLDLYPILDSLNEKETHSRSDSILLNTLVLYPTIYPESPVTPALLYKLGIIRQENFLYEGALDLYNKGLLAASKFNQPQWLQKINMKIPELYLDLQWYQDVVVQSNLLLEEGLESTQDSIHVYNMLGIAYLNKSDNYKSLEAFHKSIELNKAIQDSLNTASSLNNIGVVFNNLERFDKAIAYYKQAQKIYFRQNDSMRIARSHNNIGAAYLSKEMLDSAQWHFNQSLTIREAIGDKKGLASTYNNVGILFEEQGMFTKAESFYQKSFQLKKQINDMLGMANYYLNIGFLKDKQDQPKTAINYLKQAYTISKEYNFWDNLYQSAQGIAEIQARENNFVEAYRFRTLETQYYDSLYKQNQAIQIKKLERKQSLQAIKQMYENEYALDMMESELKQKRQQITILLLSAGFLVALIAIYFIYRHKRWIARKNKTLAESNQRIKESEQFVLQSLNRTRALLDNSIVGIAQITCDGTIKQVNSTLCKISGYTEGELINQTVDIFYQEQVQRQEVINLRDAAFKNRQTFEYEGVFYSKDKRPVPVHVSGRPLNFDVCEEIVWVVRDMSQLKQTQLQLNWFERFVESSNQGLAMATLDGELVHLNPYMESLFGAREVKKTIYNSYPASMQVKLSNEVMPAVLRDGSWQGELQQQTLNGSLVNTLEHFFVLKNEHGHAAYIADIITDITHLKKMEKELYDANKAKDQLFSIIGHDLRSPLGTLDSMLQLLLTNIKTMERERLHNIVENLQASASETYALLENLLFWARGQQNKMQVTPVALNVHRIASTVRNLLINNALIKDITLSLNIPENLTVKADEIMTSTIIRNLVTNAIKFTPEGGEIHIEAKSTQEMIQFMVKDTGIGIPAADIPRLFDENEFYSSIGTQNEAGTGIGLILCYKFVKANGGEIWVNSEVGEGSTFFFTLPKA